MKTIMMLGGNSFQVSAIKRAKELGYHVITVDYLPDNPGHQFADEYYNVSTIDKDAVLELARKLEIDGILSYGSDVSAPTAAYVAEALGLPTNPYDSVLTLTHKDRFRAFMHENGFPRIEGKCFENRGEAFEYALSMKLPLIVKPVDSSGSKGVTKLNDLHLFDAAYTKALEYSISKRVIIERFIPKRGYQIDGDGFIVDGKIAYWGVMDQHNNVLLNPHAPIGLSSPSIQDETHKELARELVQDIFDRLGMKFGAFNFEYIIGEDNQIYILEIGPRNGGNFIPDTIRYCQEVDTIEASIKACLGDEYDTKMIPGKNECASSYVIHSMQTGKFKALHIDESVQPRIVKQHLFVHPGDQVNTFRNGGDSIGAMIIRFDSIDQMLSQMDRMWELISVEIE